MGIDLTGRVYYRISLGKFSTDLIVGAGLGGEAYIA